MHRFYGAHPMLGQQSQIAILHRALHVSSASHHNLDLLRRLNSAGGERVQLSEWWADFDERFMRPVFSRADSGEMHPPDAGQS